MKIKRNLRGAPLSLGALVICLVILVMSLSGCSSDTLMTIGKSKVPYDVVRSFVLNYKQGYSDEQLADEAVREKIRNDVISDLKMTYVVRNVAQDMNLKLTDEAKKNVKKQLDYFKSDDNYKDNLDRMNATEKVLEELLEISELNNIIYDAITDNAEPGTRFATDNDTIDADLLSSEWFAAEWIILTYDSSGKEARLVDFEDALKKVQGDRTLSIAARELEKLYGNELTYADDGCFTNGIYSEDLENAVKELESGQTSGVIETVTSTGYSCFLAVRRMDIEEIYVDENYDTIISYYLAREYDEYMTEMAEKLEVSYDEKYADFDILDIV